MSGLRVGREPMDDLDDRLRVADFGRVDRAVEEIERAPFLREPLGFRLGQPARIGQTPVDRDEPIEPRQVLRRADGGQHVRIAHRRLAELLVLERGGRLREMLEVLEDLRVLGELAVGADPEAEELLRCLDRAARYGCRAPAARWQARSVALTAPAPPAASSTKTDRRISGDPPRCLRAAGSCRSRASRSARLHVVDVAVRQHEVRLLPRLIQPRVVVDRDLPLADHLELVARDDDRRAFRQADAEEVRDIS